jgi:hypothetical protein
MGFQRSSRRRGDSTGDFRFPPKFHRSSSIPPQIHPNVPRSEVVPSSPCSLKWAGGAASPRRGCSAAPPCGDGVRPGQGSPLSDRWQREGLEREFLRRRPPGTDLRKQRVSTSPPVPRKCKLAAVAVLRCPQQVVPHMQKWWLGEPSQISSESRKIVRRRR